MAREGMRLTLSAVALLACTSLASAADLGGPNYGSLKDEPYIAAAPFSWTGLYVGAHAGWATGEWNGNLVYDTGSGPQNIWGASNSRSIDAEGWLGGVQLGYNYQHGSIVFGLEADATWADLEEEQSFGTVISGQPGSYRWDIRNQLDAFGTVRGRLGFLVKPTLLLYGTGGFAWGRTSSDLTVFGDGAVRARGSADETHVGWAAGAGAEWAFAPNWSIRGEWLHIDLGEEDYHLTGAKVPSGAVHTTDSFPAELEFDVFRVGVNYKFGR